jgi:quercetin dioxygenase-like cupin family protein
MLHRFDDHELVRLHLSPGESIENHVNEWRIVFFVLRGKGSLHVEGQVHHLAEQQSIAVEAGKERFWTSTGKQPLELLVIKTNGK